MGILNISALFLVGVLGGWALRHWRSIQDKDALAELRARVRAGEETLGDAKRQLDLREKDVEGIRSRLEISERERAVAETRAEEANKRIEEERRILNDAETKLTTAFQALSGESLKSNNKAFLELARESLEVTLKEAKGDIEKKEESIKNVVKPLEDILARYERQIGDMEKTRAEAYGNLEGHIRSLMDTQQSLQKETGNLVTALRRPEVRGRWGEVTLKRVAELAGMTAHCDYSEQVSVSTDDGRSRPDMIIHLPAEREIVVDSKVSLDAYLDAIVADTDDKRKVFMAKHAQQIRKHMRDLSSKGYWDQFQRAPEFVVMFIPGEAFLSAAVENDPKLIEDGMDSGVIIATPTTLIALLRAIVFGWRQEKMAQSAREIADLGKELYDRFQPFLEHVNKTSGYLSQAVSAFNKMVMSLERRVMVSIKKFQELGAVGEKDLGEAKMIEQSPMEAAQSDK